MTQIEVSCQLNYDVRTPTVFLFQVTAAETEHQSIIDEKFSITPDVQVERCQVGFEGNQLQRVFAQPGQLQVNYQATANLKPEIDQPAGLQEWDAQHMPADVLPYLNPSRYCESDVLSRFAFEEFGSLQRGYSRVVAICEWVNGHLDYTPGSTTSTTTAADVLVQRVGVCRDYAHLAISLCRAVGIPARYVAGYAVDLQPPDFHGFIEAFLDGQWYLFDPTKLAPVSGLVRIGVGRDAADVSFATITGQATLTQQTVQASGQQAANRASAVSTA
ncbi:transglutaminase-like domain-containing protein [Fuerstiella marisgermanici]|uniref:Transglutaminase-like domain-containing protein n=1 Tax=Fuerstiella marisgermanici TaxID=1891926 RepID=A0A1P8WCQ1_9PLAN|nr:transglutaminase family protein [Fuerstiella marisgermanici]APZ91838.1 putative protein involved in cytokinesis, contains TGc (transglutaminase/protease-like) domain [Fuerstiella marisgermanici]